MFLGLTIMFGMIVMLVSAPILAVWTGISTWIIVVLSLGGILGGLFIADTDDDDKQKSNVPDWAVLVLEIFK